MKQPCVQVYAIVRVDADSALQPGSDGPGIGAERLRGVELRGITVTSVVPTLEEAAAEVDRLNALNADKGATYFWMATRYYPDGRGNE